MTVFRFDDLDSKHRALGYLAGRFSFNSWPIGGMAVPEDDLAPLAYERIASYEHLMPTILDSNASAV